eukprot:11367332-Karenia_brevis.AAC.1
MLPLQRADFASAAIWPMFGVPLLHVLRMRHVASYGPKARQETPVEQWRASIGGWEGGLGVDLGAIFGQD